MQNTMIFRDLPVQVCLRQNNPTVTPCRQSSASWMLFSPAQNKKLPPPSRKAGSKRPPGQGPSPTAWGDPQSTALTVLDHQKPSWVWCSGLLLSASRRVFEYALCKWNESSWLSYKQLLNSLQSCSNLISGLCLICSIIYKPEQCSTSNLACICCRWPSRVLCQLLATLLTVLSLEVEARRALPLCFLCLWHITLCSPLLGSKVTN